jgi:hypothetical protein
MNYENAQDVWEVESFIDTRRFSIRGCIPNYLEGVKPPPPFAIELLFSIFFENSKTQLSDGSLMVLS